MEFIKKIVEIYRGTPMEAKGGILGAIIAFMFMWLGFLKMLFLIFCIVVGIIIGGILKGKKEAIFVFIKDLIARILPSKWMR